jgi:hypothetical protein
LPDAAILRHGDELAPAAFRDPSIDRRVGDARQRGDLVVSEAEPRLQIERLAILGLDQPKILEPSGVEHPVGDLVGELTIVAGW